jgi:hypothetical protein
MYGGPGRRWRQWQENDILIAWPYRYTYTYIRVLELTWVDFVRSARSEANRSWHISSCSNNCYGEIIVTQGHFYFESEEVLFPITVVLLRMLSTGAREDWPHNESVELLCHRYRYRMKVRAGVDTPTQLRYQSALWILTRFWRESDQYQLPGGRHRWCCISTRKRCTKLGYANTAGRPARIHVTTKKRMIGAASISASAVC